VTRWPLRIHGAAIGVVILLSVINGYLLTQHTDAAFPYLDSLTTWSAIWATFLVARKVLENWWYWLVIDIASVFIYLARDLQLTSMLFVVYVIMIPFGLLSWSRSMREQPA
jgi:nicotinamide mononucleotide transporter